MKLLFIIFFLAPTLCFSQFKGINTFSAGPENLINGSGLAFGAQLSGNLLLSKGSFMGLEIGYLKFPKMTGLYVPVSLKLTAVINDDPNKTRPIIMIQPGYGLYNERDSESSTIVRKGGTTIYTGIGVAFAATGNKRGYLMAGYSNYGFENNSVRSRIESIGLRAGMIIL
jgi:hypothetical protein